MADGPSSPFDSGVDPEAMASAAGSIKIANEVVVSGAVVDVVDVAGATVVDVVLVVDVVGTTVVDVVLVVDVVGTTVVDAVVDVVAAVVAAGSATGSGAVDPHANPIHASTARTRTANVTRRTAPLTATTIDGPTLQLPVQSWSGLFRFGSDHHAQAAYRSRDVAKQRELARTNDQSERQARGGFRTFVQVSGLGCIDLGDRRSGVQISPTRPTKL